MGFLKDPLPPDPPKYRPRKRHKRPTRDAVTRLKQGLELMEGTSLTALEIIGPKLAIRIQRG